MRKLVQGLELLKTEKNAESFWLLIH